MFEEKRGCGTAVGLALYSLLKGYLISIGGCRVDEEMVEEIRVFGGCGAGRGCRLPEPVQETLRC